MSQRRGNGSIRSYFKPTTRSQTPKTSRTATPKPPSPSPVPPSSPSSQKDTTPIKKKPLSRDIEIGASDDEESLGNSSDESLEDLSTILGRGRPRKASRSPVKNPFATPKAKRTAVEFHSSPLAIIPRHKFDLKALAKDAKQDAATNASSLKIKNLPDIVDKDVVTSKKDASQGILADIVADNAGQDAQKVLRAVQRSHPGQSQLRYCFFLQDFTPPTPKSASRKLGEGPWRLLTRGDLVSQERHLASGLPQTLLGIYGTIPDELFEWLLDGLCVSRSVLVRQEYCSLLSSCTEQLERLLTPRRLEELFYHIGAAPGLDQKDSVLPMTQPASEPYSGRDWSCVISLLEFLQDSASHMSLTSVIYTIQTLLRMSLDKIVIYSMDILLAYQNAIGALIETIPSPSWNQFCHETCSLMHTLVEAQGVRINALGCLPVSNPKVHELRRRLAVTSLFGDSLLARHSPDNVVTLRGIINRLGEEDFSVGPDTDFAELRASIILLDMVVDDGSFVATDDPEDEKLFNADVDELTTRLREVWRRINDAGMKLARTETKSVIEWVQQRLAHSVRTRKKVKKSIFDIPRPAEDPFLPRQQDYMKNFLKKAPEPTKEPGIEDTIVVRFK